MAHVRPRLSPFSRLLLVQRAQQRPVAHVAAELGVSRQTAYRWVRRYAADGEAGLLDRPSRPHRSPRRTAPELEAQILALRAASRRGPVWLAAQLGAHPSTIGRVLRRHQVPLLRDLDPVTGAQLRTSKASAGRYERARAGELLHLDVKKLGRIPPGGRLAAARPRRRRSGPGPRDRLRLRPRRRRRPHPAGLRRGPRRRARRYLCRLPDSSRRVLRRPWRQHPARAHRQRVRLPPQPGVLGGAGHPGRQPSVHPPPLPLDQRQGRTVHPHPDQRMGLPAAVAEHHPTRGSLAGLAAGLQHSTPTHRTRRPPTHHPTVTRLSPT